MREIWIRRSAEFLDKRYSYILAILSPNKRSNRDKFNKDNGKKIFNIKRTPIITHSNISLETYTLILLLGMEFEL